MSIRHAKARGEWAELRFMTRATELGFRVGNLVLVILREHVFYANEGPERAARTRRAFCDALLARLARILVRRRHRASRTLSPRPGKVHHLPPGQLLQMSPRLQQSPLFAPRPRLHRRAVIPTDTWYILPIRATNGQPDILLSPQSPRAKNEKYKEAWHLLKR